MPADLAEKARTHAYYSKSDRVLWQRILQRRGWFAAHWPRAHGGDDWGALQRFLLIEELEFAGTPWLTHLGVSFAGPVIYTYGTEAQRAAYLPGILNSDTWWCQGFSEPGAGSDLAAVRTRAIMQGDHYVVSGQKTWTTMAQWADMIFALVRTGDTGKRRDGLSLLLIDLKSPGVTVRPIPTIDGLHHINDVFFDDVRVPAANLVGREGGGWECAQFIVKNERPLVTELGKAKRLFQTLRRLFAASNAAARHAAPRHSFNRRLAELEILLAALEALAYAAFGDSAAGTTSFEHAAQLKIRGSEMQQALFDAIIDLLAPGMPFDKAAIAENQSAMLPGHELATRLLSEHLYSRATSIYGGSNEIQRHIIAKALIG